MSFSVLLFPQTAPGRSALAGLLPLCEFVLVMVPSALPGFGQTTPASTLARAGLVSALSPPAAGGSMGEAGARRLAALLRQWEQWVAEHHGSGQAEALKAGLVLPTLDFETMNSLLGDIRGYGQPAPPAGGQPALPPEAEAALWLHLLHRQDQQAGELEELIARAEAGQRRLDRLMDLDEEDHQPADYEQAFAARLAPLDYHLNEDRLVVCRLRAWAALAGGLEDTVAWLATDSQATVSWLRERINARLTPAEERRSPAGAFSPLGGSATDEPDPDSPFMQEAFRLVLPDLSGLDEEGLLGLRGRLDEAGALEPARRGLTGLLERLACEPWSGRLKAELAAGTRELAETLAATITAALVAETLNESGPSSRALSVLAIPGLTRADLLALMAGGPDGHLPRCEDWPEKWPAGSLPLLVTSS